MNDNLNELPLRNSPFELIPIFFFCLIDDLLLQRLGANGSHGTLTVIVQDGRYLAIAPDVFLGRVP